MLTAMMEMTLPCLCLCSITNISTPAAPWTNREEKRAQRKIQYHISVRFLSTVPWAQRLRTCCTDRLIIEWSAPSALIVPAGRQRGAPGGAARRVSQAASSPPGRHRGAREGEAWAAGGTAAPAQGPRRAAGARHATRLRSRREARADRQPAGAGRGTRLIAGTRDEAAAPGRGTCRPPAARP